MTSSYMHAPGSRRVHVTNPEHWNRAAGTDYWAVFGPEAITAAAGSSALLSDAGWTTTSLVETAGSGADLIATADRGAPAHVLTNASGDLLQSPAVFGDYGHAQIAATILGYQPTKLVCEFYAAMTVNSVNENTSQFGLCNVGSAPSSLGPGVTIYTDGTNFTLLTSDINTDVGALDDALWHKFRIALSNVVAAGTGMVEWFIDGTSQGTTNMPLDALPMSFGMHASTTNRPALAWVHVWYE